MLDLAHYRTVKAAAPPGSRCVRKPLLSNSRCGFSFPGKGEPIMHLMYFTEQPMSAYFAQAGLDFGATALMFSNKHFDPSEGSRLYNEYLEHYLLVDELG